MRRCTACLWRLSGHTLTSNRLCSFLGNRWQSGTCRIKHRMSRLEFIVKYLRRQSLTWHFIQALVLTALIGFIDYCTGNEVTVDPFYAIPILLLVWFGNKNLAIVIAVFCALAWWWAN